MKFVVLIILLITLTACGNPSGAIIGAHKLFNKGEYSEAISKALHASNKYELTNKEHAELDYIVAESYAKIEETEKSLAMYKLIVEIYPETKYAHLSQTVLEKN